MQDTTIDGQFASLALTLPAQSELIDEIDEVDPVLLHEIYEFVMLELAISLRPVFVDIVKKNDEIPGEQKPILGQTYKVESVDLCLVMHSSVL